MPYTRPQRGLMQHGMFSVLWFPQNGFPILLALLLPSFTTLEVKHMKKNCGGFERVDCSKSLGLHRAAKHMTQHPRNPTVHEIRSEAARSKLEKLR